MHDPFVSVRAAVPDAVLDVRYATPRNFLGRAVYPEACEPRLKSSTASKLAKAAALLRVRGRRLVILDAYRPLSVQKLMWAAKPDTRFVADPARGSSHNRGGAVDAALADAAGRPLPMPCAFDEFGPLAAHGAPGVSQESRAEAESLKAAMEQAGLKSLPEEWWHYEDPAAKNWPVLDTPFDELPE